MEDNQIMKTYGKELLLGVPYMQNENGVWYHYTTVVGEIEKRDKTISELKAENERLKRKLECAVDFIGVDKQFVVEEGVCEYCPAEINCTEHTIILSWSGDCSKALHKMLDDRAKEER